MVIAEYRAGNINAFFIVTTGSSAIVTFDSESKQPGNGILFGYQEGKGITHLRYSGTISPFF